MHDWIIPDWPAPESVRSVITTRGGGQSKPPYDSLNLADHVNDEPELIRLNRQILANTIKLPSEPVWLEQVHGCSVAELDKGDCSTSADVSVATEPGKVCVVMTADCLPLLICNSSGTKVAAVHAGWRGLADGVIESALDQFADPGEELMAWLGPAIGPDKFEVGDEVREIFLTRNASDEDAFSPHTKGKWLADIYKLARRRLSVANCGYVGGGDYCTVSDSERFFSYRRDGVTGRMASLIWIE